MGAGRAERFKIRSSDARKTKAANRLVKDRERIRRAARMVAKIKASGPPYSPAVMSWLSRRLEKPATRITPADIQRVLKEGA